MRSGRNRIFVYLAGVTVGLSSAAGLLMHWIDEETFPTVGTGIWWAVVTFCTVGYGDVPTDPLGRLVAAIVMVFAITFIAIVTALVTSSLVTARQSRAQGAAEDTASRALERIETRLEAIERRLR